MCGLTTPVKVILGIEDLKSALSSPTFFASPLPTCRLLTKWVAPAGCDFEIVVFAQILVAPGGRDPPFCSKLDFIHGLTTRQG